MTIDTDTTHNRLIAEQLGHTLDLIKAEISTLQAEQAHQSEMNLLRLKSLEGQAADFEKRLRDLTESATQFKLLVSLAVGGGLLSVISLLRSLLNP
jgi:HD-like signal output (HDOD) protein